MILDILAWAFLGLTLLSAIAFGFKRFLVIKMAEAFEVGAKVGRAVALQGPEWLDEQLLASGVDPAKLPGR